MLRKIILLAGAAALVKNLLSRARAPQFEPAGSPGADRAEAGPAGDGAVGHRPADLMGDVHPDGSQRADDHFRPDPTGRVDARDLESLRPVTMPAPRDAPGL